MWPYSPRTDRFRWVVLRVSYNIVNVLNGKVLDVGSRSSGARCQCQTFVPGNDQHCWELVVPAVAYPPGWVHIQNARTQDLLSHTYLYNSPVLEPSPASLRPSQHREGWRFQWTMVHSKSFRPRSAAGRNLWCIVNRLTRGHLENTLWLNKGINAWQTLPSGATGNPISEWRLELDPACNWKIINSADSSLLEQTSSLRIGGTEVVCVNGSFSLRKGSQSWILRCVCWQKELVPDPSLFSRVVERLT